MSKLKETEINNLILDNITADEKFKIICRVKDFDIQEIAEEIYNIIDYYDDYEHNDYIGICGYEDESMEIEDKYYIDIDDGLLYIKNEFDDRQKEFIKLAIQCNIKRIILM